MGFRNCTGQSTLKIIAMSVEAGVTLTNRKMVSSSTNTNGYVITALNFGPGIGHLNSSTSFM